MVQWKAQQASASLQPIQVSPRGFKANLENLVNALIDVRMPATVLAKLPRGVAWFEDLKRYGQTVTPAPDIYVLGSASLATTDWYTAVPIPADHALSGEYILIAISDTAGVMMVGHRETVDAPPTDSEDNQSSESADHLVRVNLKTTWQSIPIQEKLDELRQLFQGSLAEQPDQQEVTRLVADWDIRLQVPDHPDAFVVDALLAQQGSFQERLRRQARQYRRQAMTASSLSTQNESLMNTLRLKDDFLSTVGQELRSPLSTIKTALPLLASQSLKPPQRQRYLDMISRECSRQSSLINGVLDLLQLERSLSTATPESVKLFDVVPGIVSTYQPIAQEKGIRLAYTVPSDLPLVRCPESWVRQAVIHLLNNSIRYTEAGGEVWVTAQAEEDTLILNVKDTGTGIQPNELPHIFEHFYRGKQPNQDDEGAGLGLTIVQQLLLYCGGQISVESQPNVGTHFKVMLPIAQDD